MNRSVDIIFVHLSAVVRMRGLSSMRVSPAVGSHENPSSAVTTVYLIARLVSFGLWDETIGCY